MAKIGRKDKNGCRQKRRSQRGKSKNIERKEERVLDRGKDGQKRRKGCRQKSQKMERKEERIVDSRKW